MKNNTAIYIILSVLGLIISVCSCKKEKLNDLLADPTPYTIEIPKFFPTNLNIPSDNPMTVEGIELGRYLFYDGRLCGKKDTLMSCGTCHNPSFSFENGTGFGIGTTGIPSPHVMLPLINLVFNTQGYLWNGKVEINSPVYSIPGAYGGNIEDLCWMGVYAPHEMNSDTNKAKAAIQNIPMYPPMFKKAFGSEVVTFKNISKAIAQFIRTLISSNSKFDKYLRGEVNLTTDEMNGYAYFNTEEADCFHCHGTILFTTNGYYNNAKDTIFNDARDRYAVTLNPMDKGAYKAPTLRNIALTGPYMHDGRFKTLDDVIDFYSEGLMWSAYAHPFMVYLNDGGVQLNPKQKADLKAFLLTLTDTEFVSNPSFSKPAALP